MGYFLAYSTTLLFLLLAAWISALNLYGAWANWLSRREGVGRWHSPIPLLAQVFAWVSMVIAAGAKLRGIPGAVFWMVGLSDIAIWQVFHLHPVTVAWRWVARRRAD